MPTTPTTIRGARSRRDGTSKPKRGSAAAKLLRLQQRIERLRGLANTAEQLAQAEAEAAADSTVSTSAPVAIVAAPDSDDEAEAADDETSRMAVAALAEMAYRRGKEPAFLRLAITCSCCEGGGESRLTFS